MNRLIAIMVLLFLILGLAYHPLFIIIPLNIYFAMLCYRTYKRDMSDD